MVVLDLSFFSILEKISMVTRQLLGGINDNELLSRYDFTALSLYCCINFEKICTLSGHTFHHIWRLFPENPEDFGEDGEFLSAYEALREASRSHFIIFVVFMYVFVTYYEILLWSSYIYDFVCPSKHRVMQMRSQAQKQDNDREVQSLRLQMDHLQNENNQLQKLFQEENNIKDSIRQEVARLTAENMVGGWRCRLKSKKHHLSAFMGSSQQNVIAVGNVMGLRCSCVGSIFQLSFRGEHL